MLKPTHLGCKDLDCHDFELISKAIAANQLAIKDKNIKLSIQLCTSPTIRHQQAGT